MTDDFLYKFRIQPKDEYAEELYHRITEGATNARKAYVLLQLLRWTILMLAVIVLGGCSYLALSPTARAKVLDQIRQIAGVTYNETPQYPKIEPEQIVQIQFHEVRLNEAQEKLPFTLIFPSWIPDGYSLFEDHVMYYSYDEESVDISKAYNVYLTWSRNNIPGGGNIILIEQPIFSSEQYLDNMMPVGPGSLSEVKIGEETGAIIRGSWNSETQLWNAESGQITLRWTLGDMHYLLVSDERSVDFKDLLKMAESIK